MTWFIFRDESYLWWLFFPPVCLLGHLPWLRHAQNSTSTGDSVISLDSVTPGTAHPQEIRSSPSTPSRPEQHIHRRFGHLPRLRHARNSTSTGDSVISLVSVTSGTAHPQEIRSSPSSPSRPEQHIHRRFGHLPRLRHAGTAHPQEIRSSPSSPSRPEQHIHRRFGHLPRLRHARNSTSTGDSVISLVSVTSGTAHSQEIRSSPSSPSRRNSTFTGDSVISLDSVTSGTAHPQEIRSSPSTPSRPEQHIHRRFGHLPRLRHVRNSTFTGDSASGCQLGFSAVLSKWNWRHEIGHRLWDTANDTILSQQYWNRFTDAGMHVPDEQRQW